MTRWRIGLVILACALVILFLLDRDPQSRPIANGAAAQARAVRISWPAAGTVQDLRGKPVAGARVRAVWIDYRFYADVGFRTRVVSETVSDAAGRYALDAGHDAESTYLVAEARGYARGTISLLDVFAQGWDKLVVPDAPAMVMGYVIDAETRSPLGGVEVMASYGGEGPAFAKAGVDGRFVFEGVPAGELDLGAAPPGYAPARVHRSVARRQKIELTLELHRGVVVEGVVETPDGERVAGALIWISQWPRRHVTSDAEGRFRYEGYPKGEEGFVTAVAPGYTWITVQLKTPGSLTLLLTPAAMVEGRVLTEHGRPVANARVIASSLDDLPVQTATAADGTFLFDHIPPEKGKTLDLEVQAPGYVTTEIRKTPLGRAGRVDVGVVVLRPE